MAMVTTRRLNRTPDGWELPIAGIPVSRFIVDYGFTLAFTEASFDCAIRFEGLLTLVQHTTSTAHDVTKGDQLTPLFSLLGVPAVSGFAHENGSLRIVFENGWQVLANADAECESWQLYSSSGAKIVCSPGGTLVVWKEVQ
jgi:hypothetical protein